MMKENAGSLLRRYPRYKISLLLCTLLLLKLSKRKKQEKNYMAKLPLCNFSPYPYMDFCELIDLTYGGKTPGIFECPI